MFYEIFIFAYISVISDTINSLYVVIALISLTFHNRLCIFYVNKYAIIYTFYIT
jgi:hypothetical protein